MRQKKRLGFCNRRCRLLLVVGFRVGGDGQQVARECDFDDTICNHSNWLEWLPDFFTTRGDRMAFPSAHLSLMAWPWNAQGFAYCVWHLIGGIFIFFCSTDRQRFWDASSCSSFLIWTHRRRCKRKSWIMEPPNFPLKFPLHVCRLTNVNESRWISSRLLGRVDI